MHVLFVCSRNRLRSPTAEALFSARDGVETLSAGTAPDAETPVSAELIDWADIIFVMEAAHRRRLKKYFGEMLAHKKIFVLGVPDKYKFMDPKLIELLRKKVPPLLQNVN
ncbi:MAG: phosphotyrosine protein phosphatase [Terracidiphilus sp.]